MIELRDYQRKAIDDVRQAFRERAKAPLLVAPTGSGKTVIFSEISHGAAQRGNNVLIMAHRQELIEQISGALHEVQIEPGIISPQYAPDYSRHVQVASVFTAVRRLAQLPIPRLIVIDEAHHATLNSTWQKILAHFPQASVLGVTATPSRLSGEGLGDVFDRLIQGPTVADLVARGYLATPRVFAPPTIDVSSVRTQMGDFAKKGLSEAVDRPKVTGDAIEHYQRLTPSQRAIVFCVSLDHAAHMASAARAAGISAVQIDGSMDRGLRSEIVRDFKDGRIQWLVSVDLISEGFDCPGAEVGICLRPTQSLSLWLQQCGRIMRPGKQFATILDHAGNALRHGLPTDDRTWTLDGRDRNSSRKANSVSVRVCPQCFSAQRSGKPACSNCGHVFLVDGRKVRSEKGILEEITPEELARRRARMAQGQTTSIEKLVELGRIRGYEPEKAKRWAQHVWEGRQKKQQRQREELPEKPF